MADAQQDALTAAPLVIDSGVAGLSFVGSLRCESSAPSLYRLGRRPSGELVLQGRFDWWEGALSGHDWRDLPTVELPEQA